MVKKVSIIIPNYNGQKLLAKNLPQVLMAAIKYDSATEVIIVDDASSDDSVSFIRKNFPKVVLVKKEKNEGFSSTCNLGVKNASGEIVILLNSDISPEENFISPLISNFDDRNVFAVGCLDLSMEAGREIERGRGIGRFERGFLIHLRGNIYKSTTLWASGGSSAFDRSKWMELNGMDEIYNPFYWEDIDLSYRALKKRWKVLFDKKAVVHHHHEEGAILSKYSSAEIKTIAYRNQFIFVWKNVSDKDLILQHFLWLPYHLIKALWRMDLPLLKGYFHALFRLLIKVPHRLRYPLLTDKQILKQYLN